MGYWKRRRDKRKLAALVAVAREEELAEEIWARTGETGYIGSQIDEAERNE
jgi:hypothetical protein